MGFVRGTAMVDFHIHGRLEKNGLGFSGGGGLGGGGGLPAPPKHTPDQIAGCDVQLLWHFVCLWSDGTVCTWDRLRLQTRLGTRCVK